MAGLHHRLAIVRPPSGRPWSLGIAMTQPARSQARRMTLAGWKPAFRHPLEGCATVRWGAYHFVRFPILTDEVWLPPFPGIAVTTWLPTPNRFDPFGVANPWRLSVGWRLRLFIFDPYGVGPVCSTETPQAGGPRRGPLDGHSRAVAHPSRGCRNAGFQPAAVALRACDRAGCVIALSREPAWPQHLSIACHPPRQRLAVEGEVGEMDLVRTWRRIQPFITRSVMTTMSKLQRSPKGTNMNSRRRQPAESGSAQARTPQGVQPHGSLVPKHSFIEQSDMRYGSMTILTPGLTLKYTAVRPSTSSTATRSATPSPVTRGAASNSPMR